MAAESKRIILCALRYAVLFVLAFWVGMDLPVGGGEEVAFEVSAQNTIVGCAADMAVFALLAISVRSASAVISMAVTAVRGLALGAAFGFCAVNFVPLTSVAMLLSHGMVSALRAVYAVMLSKDGISCGEKRTAYLLLTGASVLLRVMPVLFVN